jgi:hypothetical protein
VPTVENADLAFFEKARADDSPDGATDEHMAAYARRRSVARRNRDGAARHVVRYNMQVVDTVRPEFPAAKCVDPGGHLSSRRLHEVPSGRDPP